MTETMSYRIAMAAARDAGNRHMRADGRTVWAVADWNHACETFARLWPPSQIAVSGDCRSSKPPKPENAATDTSRGLQGD